MPTTTRLAGLLALGLLGLAAAPAYAQTVPADANKSLWCASAFGLVEPQARQQGQTAAADNFLKYSKALNTMSHDSLIKAGFTEDQIKTQAATYSDKVGKELTGSAAAEFSVVDCTMLVDPTAAAAMQQAPAGGDAAPADGSAPAAPAAGGDATTPAPAAGSDATTPAPASK